MNKYKIFSLILSLVTLLSVLAGAMAQEENEYKFDYSDEKMLCEIVPVGGMSEEAKENMRILGAPTADDWSVGPENALITIIEYSDFQCPYCRNASLSLIDYQKKHPDQVRLIYRHFPLSFHEKAVLAATAVNAAGDQGMFFDAAEYLFTNQSEWTSLEDNNAFTTWLVEKFGQFSDLDFERWYLAFTDNDRLQEAQDTYRQVLETGIVGGTPTVFVDYIQVNDLSEERLDQELEEAKLKDFSYYSCPDIVIEEGKEYQAVLETEAGDIHVNLFADTAPLAVNNFKYLADNGWYDDNEILRKQDGFMMQTGDPSNTMYGYPGYYFPTEYDPSRTFDGAGFLGMANSGRNRNGSQFFITYDFREYYTERIREDSEALNIEESKINDYVAEKIQKFSKAYTVFGQVAEEDMPLVSKLEEGMKINKIIVSAK
ncbi:MAG: peptidylprolyl isomerase [Anaerolineaceae bacterium]|nr:peptidylprolyl isomerase [Anaerolineaceae bacterium]